MNIEFAKKILLENIKFWEKKIFNEELLTKRVEFKQNIKNLEKIIIFLKEKKGKII